MAEFFSTVFSEFVGLAKEIFGAICGVIPGAFYFMLWVISAIFILPCVFVAGTLYPKWVEWGEGM